MQKKEDLSEVLKQETEANIKASERIIEELEDKIRTEKLRIVTFKKMIDCEHDWKVDISFGGSDIETCKKCKKVHYC